MSDSDPKRVVIEDEVVASRWNHLRRESLLGSMGLVTLVNTVQLHFKGWYSLLHSNLQEGILIDVQPQKILNTHRLDRKLIH